MKKEDYTIIIKADANDEVYWQMLRKGEPAACNEEEEKLAEEMLGDVFHKLEVNVFGSNQSVKNLTKISFAKITVKAINRQAGALLMADVKITLKMRRININNPYVSFVINIKYE